MLGNTDKPKKGVTPRYRAKRDLILDAAARRINAAGAHGMTLGDVAASVGMNATSVTYYFRRREQLAAACYDQSLDRIEGIVTDAERASGPRERVRAYVAAHFAQHAAIRAQHARPCAVLSDLRALDGPERAALAERYRGLLRRIRGFFGNGDKALLTARTHVLVEATLWLPSWLNQHDLDEYPRLSARMVELFDGGLALPDAAWAPRRTRLDPGMATDEDGARHNFLMAATRLINERGYRGASVERIASELNVTKGSFYHHLGGKDELVVDCFTHSFDVQVAALRMAEAVGGSQWERLCSAMAMLLDVQFSDQGPLLRTTALHALPPDLRGQMAARTNHLTRRLAGMVIDGISEGTLRAIDPLVASHALAAMLNAAYELRNWAGERADTPSAIADYASTLCHGLFAAAPPVDRRAG